MNNKPTAPLLQSRDPERPPVSPMTVAALLTALYVVLLSAYIIISSTFAALASTSIEHLERIEMFKGIAFVLVTGGGFFALTFFVMRRIARQELQILRQQGALVASEGKAMAGIFATSIAHDMKNLLAVAHGYMSLLKEDLRRIGKKNEAERMAAAVENIADLATKLLSVGRSGSPGHKQQIDLADLVRRIVAFAPTHMKVRRCRLSTKLDQVPLLGVNESLLSRCLMNLILNAAEATGGEGIIEVRLTRAADVVYLEVHDNGPGVPVEIRQIIFDPFYSSKPDGSGLGLLSVKVCAEEHGGMAEVVESDLGGACFRMSFPLK